MKFHLCTVQAIRFFETMKTVPPTRKTIIQHHTKEIIFFPSPHPSQCGYLLNSLLYSRLARRTADSYRKDKRQNFFISAPKVGTVPTHFFLWCVKSSWEWSRIDFNHNHRRHYLKRRMGADPSLISPLDEAMHLLSTSCHIDGSTSLVTKVLHVIQKITTTAFALRKRAKTSPPLGIAMCRTMRICLLFYRHRLFSILFVICLFVTSSCVWAFRWWPQNEFKWIQMIQTFVLCCSSSFRQSVSVSLINSSLMRPSNGVFIVWTFAFVENRFVSPLVDNMFFEKTVCGGFPSVTFVEGTTQRLFSPLFGWHRTNVVWSVSFRQEMESAFAC